MSHSSLDPFAAHQNKSKPNQQSTRSHLVSDYIPIHLSGTPDAPTRSRGVLSGIVDNVQPMSLKEGLHPSGGSHGPYTKPLATPYKGFGTSYKGHHPTSLLQDDTSFLEGIEAADYFERRVLSSGMEPSTLYRGDEPANPWKDHASPSVQSQIYHHPPQHRQPPKNAGLSILSIDGGGVRGTISLLMLKSLLRRLQPEGDIFPYLYFDVICGTSTGGLIAILLGVLHLDIDTALMLYQKLSKIIFRKGYSRVRYLFKDAGYDRKPLEYAFNKILDQYGKGRTFMVDSERDRGCRCFVTTTHCVGQRRDVLPIRSYRVRGEQSIPDGYQWTILDAALATSAAPGYFDRYYVSTNDHQFGFEDAGAYGANNPTEIASQECKNLGGGGGISVRNRDINRARNNLLTSLGTGSSAASIDPSPGFFGLFRNKSTILRALQRRITNVQGVDDRMQREARGSNITYHRLAPLLSGRIGLGDWDKIPAMQATAAGYNTEHQGDLDRCASQLGQFQTTEQRHTHD